VIYLLAFVVLVLAVARVTRVLVIDEIAFPLRRWVLTKWPAPSKPAKLITCYWCAGFWVSLVACTYVSATGWLPWVALPLATFAVAYASSWVLDKEEAANGV
jgi:hypothetical protein